MFDLSVIPVGRLVDEFVPEDWATSKEVADLFGVNPKTAYRWNQAGKLNEVRRFYTPGGHRRYYLPDLIQVWNKTQVENNEN